MTDTTSSSSPPAPEAPPVLTGACMCGAVSYRITTKPLFSALCHCNRCRPQSGASYSTVGFFERAGLEVTGETHDFDDIGTSGLRVLRRSCAACGSPMFTIPDATPTLLMVKVGGFHQTDWINPTAELFVIRRLRWVNPIPGATQYEGNPPT